MTGVDVRGVSVSVDRSGRGAPKLRGTNSEKRGLLAKRLIQLGHTMTEAARVIRVSRMQLYRDLSAADGWIRDNLDLDAFEGC